MLKILCAALLVAGALLIPTSPALAHRGIRYRDRVYVERPVVYGPNYRFGRPRVYGRPYSVYQYTTPSVYAAPYTYQYTPSYWNNGY